MPTPKKNETEKDFINRCIPIVIKDGTAEDSKQAYAICKSMYKSKPKETAKENEKEHAETILGFN